MIGNQAGNGINGERRATTAGRFAAFAVATGIGAVMIGFGGPASAAPLAQPVVGHTDGLPIAEATTQCEVNSLTINLAKDLPAGVDPSGYTFTIREVVGIDVGTEEGRAEGAAMSVYDAGQREHGVTKTATTDASGTVVFTDLPPGMYLVAGKRPDGPEYEGYEPIPFTIFLPTGGIDAEGNMTGWDCDTDLERKLEDPDKPPPTTPPTEPTTPPTTEPGTPPTKPGTPTTKPGTPTTPKSTTPGAPGPGGGGGSSLPLTGVSVIGALVVAAGMVAAGIALRRRNAPDEP